MKHHFALWLLLAGQALAAVADSPPVPSEDVPEGVQMFMERGGIPAVFDPEFVGAESADIPDSAWVFGVHLGGVAKAYSLNLLNHHEVVNDESGGQPFATVW